MKTIRALYQASDSKDNLKMAISIELPSSDLKKLRVQETNKGLLLSIQKGFKPSKDFYNFINELKTEGYEGVAKKIKVEKINENGVEMYSLSGF
jgi:hypothetical protein